MRKITGILPAIVLAVAVTAAQESYPAQSNDTTEEMLIKNERALHEAVAKADKASFRSLVLPDGVWTTREGFVPMALLVDGLEVFQLTKWDIINPRVTRLGDETAIVMYVWTGTGTFHSQPLTSTMLASTVWTRRNGKWVAVHHQQTDLVKGQ
jgi:hypothetical protein